MKNFKINDLNLKIMTDTEKKLISDKSKEIITVIAYAISKNVNMPKLENLIDELNTLKKEKKNTYYFLRTVMYNYLLLQKSADELLVHMANIIDRPLLKEGVPVSLIPESTDNFVRLLLPFLVSAMDNDEKDLINKTKDLVQKTVKEMKENRE